jgi:hypothetical protein
LGGLAKAIDQLAPGRLLRIPENVLNQPTDVEEIKNRRMLELSGLGGSKSGQNRTLLKKPVGLS